MAEGTRSVTAQNCEGPARHSGHLQFVDLQVAIVGVGKVSD
jgi:hypothetical protein